MSGGYVGVRAFRNDGAPQRRTYATYLQSYLGVTMFFPRPVSILAHGIGHLL